MIIVIGGIKGGSGKTTIATNIASMRAKIKPNVLLIDADDQETSYDFSTLRNASEESLSQYTCIKLSGKSVRTEALKMKPNYDDIIIDTGGRDTVSQRAALSIADLLVVPFVPRSFDLWTLETVSGIVDEIKQINPKIISYAFLNRADARGMDNFDAQECIRDTSNIQMLQDCIVCNRKAFGNAASEGKSVTELRVQDKKASFEIELLYEYIFKKRPL